MSTNMGTGYVTYNMESDNNRVLVIPEEYDANAGIFLNILKDKTEKDRAYLNCCMSASYHDFKAKTGLEQQNALSNYEFFQAVLKSMGNKKLRSKIN